VEEGEGASRSPLAAALMSLKEERKVQQGRPSALARGSLLSSHSAKPAMAKGYSLVKLPALSCETFSELARNTALASLVAFAELRCPLALQLSPSPSFSPCLLDLLDDKNVKRRRRPEC